MRHRESNVVCVRGNNTQSNRYEIAASLSALLRQYLIPENENRIAVGGRRQFWRIVLRDFSAFEKVVRDGRGFLTDQREIPKWFAVDA